MRLNNFSENNMSVFKKALPVWPAELLYQKNIRVIFQACVEIDPETIICAATSCVYKLYVDGNFVAYGPARAGRGYFRKDILPLAKFAGGRRVISLEVQSYRVNSFYIMDQIPFLQAEILSGGNVVAFTGGDGFIAQRDISLVQKVQRFDFQRPFIEAYKLKADSFCHRCEQIINGLELRLLKGGRIIERTADYPAYEYIEAKPVFAGKAEKTEKPEYTDSRSYTGIGLTLKGFAPEELEWHISREVQGYKYAQADSVDLYNLREGEYSVYELPYDATGFADFEINCESNSELLVIFDEDLTDGDVCITSDECCRAVKYILEKGDYKLSFFEVYCMKYIKFFVRRGSCNIGRAGLVTYIHKPVTCDMSGFSADEKLLARAAVNTYRANAVDLFTDCPSRERGGYLCDSFFTAKTEYLLTGKSKVEKSFLENFLHEDSYCRIDGGMVPMCYPADHIDGVYIPNWGLWLILELADYLKRSNDTDLIEAYRGKVEGILEFHRKLENADGLLTNVPEGVFVEWSHANELVQDINFPSNMLYCAALNTAAGLYGYNEYSLRAEKTKASVIKYSYDGEFFHDLAMVSPEGIETTGDITEVCQYYAFCFGIADRDGYPRLFELLVNEFSKKRRSENRYPEICFAELFIGIPLRIEMLLKYGEYERAYDEIMYYYLPQAEKTGTLWEGLYAGCSRNHGFSSIVLYWLDLILKHRS